MLIPRDTNDEELQQLSHLAESLKQYPKNLGTIAYMPATLVAWLKKQKYIGKVTWRDAVVGMQKALLEAAHNA